MSIFDDELPFADDFLELTEEEIAVMQREKDFLAAAHAGDLSAVRDFVEVRGVDLNCCYTDTASGMPALHDALQRGDYALAEYLLQRGADPNCAGGSSGRTPASIALGDDRWDMRALKMLNDACRRRGGSLRVPIRAVESLWAAVDSNSAPSVAAVLANLRVSATMHCSQTRGLSLFHWAVETGKCAEVLRLLLDAERANVGALAAPPNARSTPFISAIRENRREAGEILIGASPTFLSARITDGSNALHVAVAQTNADAALWWTDFILSRGGEAAQSALNATRDRNVTPLHVALANRRTSLQVIHRLLQERPLLNVQRGSDQANALHLGFEWSPELALRMLDSPPDRMDLMQQRDDGDTPLTIALDSGCEPLARRVLELCPRAVALSRSNGMTPLHYAIASKKLTLVECLLAAGADINAKLRGGNSTHRQGESIMHLLIAPKSRPGNYAKRFEANPALAMLMLSRKHTPELDVNAVRTDGTSLLMIACETAQAPIVQKLLELHADPNLVTPEGGVCAFNLAFGKGSFEICRMLAEAGADVSKPDTKHNGETPLMTVLQRWRPKPSPSQLQEAEEAARETLLALFEEPPEPEFDWLRFLLDKVTPEGLMVQRDDGSTVLHIAIEKNLERPLLEEIIRKMPNLDSPRMNGVTALHIAARKGDLTSARTLLKGGANPNAADSHRLSPLHYACHAGQAAVAKLLVSVGCDPQQVAGPIEVDEPDGNAVELARRAGNFRLARMLMDPLRSSLAVMLHKVKIDVSMAGDGDDEASATSAVIFEPIPGPLEEGECSICGDTEMLLPLSRCGHKFCRGCLNSWFEAQFNGVQHPRCPNRDCGSIASYYDLHACMEHPEKYDEQALRKALMDIPAFRWCPKCGSGGVAPCGDAVCMQCGFHFCAECMLEAHEGTCAENLNRMLAGERGKLKEARLAHEIQESQRWIEGNTKPCPNCHCSIKKSGGCSHMTCRCCKYQFCWICLGKYQGRYTFDGTCPCQPQQQQQS